MLKLLFQTFPGRYEKLSVLELLNKMVTRPIKTDQVPVLRVWYHTPAAQEMVALFFLRGVGKKSPVYAMTVGLDPAFNDTNAIYTELLPRCTFMTTQASESVALT